MILTGEDGVCLQRSLTLPTLSDRYALIVFPERDRGDPATLYKKFLYSIEAKATIKRWAVIWKELEVITKNYAALKSTELLTVENLRSCHLSTE